MIFISSYSHNLPVDNKVIYVQYLWGYSLAKVSSVELNSKFSELWLENSHDPTDKSPWDMKWYKHLWNGSN